MGCLMTIPTVIQPAFLKEVVKIPEGLTGSINAGLQNMGQIATLLLIGLVGIASDRYGRKILIVAGFAFCIVFYPIFGHSSDIATALGLDASEWHLIIVYLSRFMLGIGLVLSHPQFVTLVADYTTAEGRGKGMALHAIMMSLGTLCVYGLFTQMAAVIGIIGAFYVGGILGLAGILVALSGLVDRIGKSHTAKKDIREVYRLVLRSFPLRAAYITGFVTRANISLTSTLIIVWMVSMAGKFGYTPLQATARAGVIMMVGNVFSILSFYIIGILLDRVGRLPVLISTLILTGIGYFFIATIDDPFSNLMFLYVSLLGFAKNGAIVAANTLASDVTPRHCLGSALGVLNTVGTLGIIFFLQVCGYLFDSISHQSPFVFKGVIDAACGIWIFIARKKIISMEKEDQAL